MNEQTKLSPEDAGRLAALRMRQELVQKDAQILQLEMQLFQAHVLINYGNADETIEIAADNSLKRTPKAVPTAG